MESKKNSKIVWFVLLVIVIVLGIITFIFKDKFFGSNDISYAKYQAVFLTNGQVYFGSISKKDNDYVVLKNIYYLQNNSQTDKTSTETQPFSLVKLGKELHGPEDVMYINRSQVLFYEDLRADSTVVQTIEGNSK